ncbi:MAG: tetratricopeptide repeat protein [Methanosarcinaceae archaeon]|nr:tetratricopeptide repeat protein [Methanosarcinaceae archaeon]
MNKSYDIEKLKEHVKSNPKNKNAWNSLAFAYLEVGKVNDALNCYEQILKRYPRDAKTYHKKAVIEEWLDLSENALKTIDLALKYDPENAENYYAKGWLLHRKGKYNESIDLFQKVIDKEPTHFNALDYLYKSLFMLSSYREIINHSETVLPMYEKMLDDLIEKEKKEEEEERRREDEKRIEDDEFSSYRFYKKLANDSFLTSFAESEKIAEKKPEKRASDIVSEKILKIYKYVSVSAMRIQDFEYAKKSLEKEMKLDPNDLTALYYSGLVEEALGNTENAIGYFNLILEKDPKFQNAKMKLANIYSMSENPEDLKKASTLFEQIVNEQPENTHARYSLAKLYEKEGDLKKASDSFKKIIEMSPRHLNSYEELAKILIRQNKITDAEKYLIDAESINPFDYEISNLCGIVYTKLEKISDAKKMFEKAIQLDPFSPKAYFNYGILNLQTEQFEEAVSNLEKAANADIQNENAYFYLGIAQSKSEKYSDALKSFKTAKELNENSNDLNKDLKEDIEKAIDFVSNRV